MRRFKCVVSYVGERYDGWQSQCRGTSIQEKIEDILRYVAGQKINIIASGRTDAGVNARGQVFMFDTEMDLSARKWQGVLNRKLPKDIHILSVEETGELFHARYNVRRKQYDYQINMGEYDVFKKDETYHCPVPLDIEKMKTGASYLIGTHDFSSFNANSLEETPNQIRTVLDISFHQEKDILTISFTGTGFLRYMVRMMSGELIEVGKGKIPPEAIREMLLAKDKRAVNKNAPAYGLTLVKVDYFELCALNDQGMIREFLVNDALPYDWTLSDLEESVQKKESLKVFALAARKAQEVLGWIYLFPEEERYPELVLKEMDQDIDTAMSLQDGFLKWAEKQMGHPVLPFQAVPFFQAKNHLEIKKND